MNRIEQTLMLRRLDGPGLDCCYHGPTSSGWRICGTSLFVDDGEACHVGYAINAGADWRLQSAHVFGTRGGTAIDAVVTASNDGGWSLNGVPQRGVAGCTDIDLGVTPAGILATLRRLRLARGEEAAVQVAQLDLRRRALTCSTHSYLRLNDRNVRLAATGCGSVMLTVDERMAVRWYPGRWEPYPAARPLAVRDRRSQPAGTVAAS